MIIRVEIEILRIADRCQHTSEICGNGHKNQSEHCPASVLICFQNIYGKWDESDQRHIICQKHAHKEGKNHQKQGYIPLRTDLPQEFFREIIKCSDSDQCTHDKHERKQNRHDAEVDISDIFPVGMHKKTGYYGKYPGNKQD